MDNPFGGLKVVEPDRTEPVASPAQVNFLNALLEERRHDLTVNVTSLSKREASRLITQLKEAPPREQTRRVVPNGTYTIVYEGDWRTIRLRDDFRQGVSGGQMAEFLSGPDNSLDFTGFAFVKGRSFAMWRRFRENCDLAQALELLLGGNPPEMREAYALRSGRCASCGKKLTVPASLHRGVGPVCAGRFT